jgi:hypothetical protein
MVERYLLASAKIIAVLCIAAHVAGSDPYDSLESTSKVVAGRAFVITDGHSLSPFSFEKVVTAVSSSSADAWLDVFNTTRTTFEQRQAVVPLAGFVAMRGNVRWLPAASIGWANVRPIAVINRFDLAPDDYSNCGEYRVIFSHRNGQRRRLHVAFETVVANPSPALGKLGCAPIAAFWWELANLRSDQERAAKLSAFFFDGIEQLPPVLSRATFEQYGRVRTSEVGDGRPNFAEFAIRRDCSAFHPCAARLTRVPLHNTPDGNLFDTNVAGERGAAFRRDFLRQVQSLARSGVNRYSMSTDLSYAITDISGVQAGFNYRLPFRRSMRTEAGQQFRDDIAAELLRIGSALTPEEIIDRSETQNCVGCHGKPGPVGGRDVFPSAFETGEHVKDDSTAQAVRLSPALETVFLPYRISVLRAYVDEVLVQRLVATTRDHANILNGEEEKKR